ncbi:MAG: acylphosphatase [Gemmatimonadetes bacterium]|nr:acylphosphatase [Gemmatimonadota bacterium]
MPARRFRVQGRVQGVGFRWWTRSLASEVGLTGSVRNLPDGSVEICAQGSESALTQLRARLDSGPPGAEVDSVEEEPAAEAPTGGFDILH